jgi:hypothetical protein
LKNVLINNNSKSFSLTCKRDSCILWFLNELNLTYQRLIGFVVSFDFISIMPVLRDRFLLCHTPIRFFLAFQDQIPIFIVGCVTTCSWGSYQLVLELGYESRSYFYEIFVFLMFFKFPVLVSIFFFLFFFAVS